MKTVGQGTYISHQLKIRIKTSQKIVQPSNRAQTDMLNPIEEPCIISKRLNENLRRRCSLQILYIIHLS